MSHRVTTDRTFRQADLVEFEPELKEQCCSFKDARKDDDTDSH